jgi:hypothetical protein
VNNELEGSGSGLLEGTIPAFVWRDIASLGVLLSDPETE